MSEDECEGSLPPPESPPPPKDPASAWQDADGGEEEVKGQKEVALECHRKAFFVIGITIIGILIVVLYILRDADASVKSTTVATTTRSTPVMPPNPFSKSTMISGNTNAKTTTTMTTKTTTTNTLNTTTTPTTTTTTTTLIRETTTATTTTKITPKTTRTTGTTTTTPSPPTWLLVAGGTKARLLTYDMSSSVELLSLDPKADPVPECWANKIRLPNLTAKHMVATSFNNYMQPLVYAYWRNATQGNWVTYKYNPSTNLWSEGTKLKRVARLFPGTSMHPSLGWVLTGGYDAAAKTLEFTTDQGSTFNLNLDKKGIIPSLTLGRYQHCQATVGEDIYVIGGGERGKDNSKYNSSVHLSRRADATDLALKLTPGDKSWTMLPNIPTKRKGPSCGVVKSGTGDPAIVVAGGHDTATSPPTEFRSVDVLLIVNMTWTQGPELPEPRSMAVSVPHGDTFLIVGGANYKHSLRTILVYSDSEWTEHETVMATPRQDHAAVLVRKEAFEPCPTTTTLATTTATNSPNPATWLMVVGGRRGRLQAYGDTDSVELLSLEPESDPVPECWANGISKNKGIKYTTSFYDNKTPVIYGQWYDGKFDWTTYRYTPANNSWSRGSQLRWPRMFPAASQHPTLGWVITGGFHNAARTSEFTLDQGRTFNLSGGIPHLPRGRYQHCQVTVGEDIFIFGGGEYGIAHPDYNRTVSFLIRADMSDVALRVTPGDRSWTALPKMPTKRKSPMCGVVRPASSSPLIVVAAGHDTATRPPTEFTSVDVLHAVDLTWRTGPALPERRSHGVSVPYGDTFLIVGGTNNAKSLSSILVYSDNRWIRHATALTTARQDHAAVLVRKEAFGTTCPTKLILSFVAES